MFSRSRLLATVAAIVFITTGAGAARAQTTDTDQRVEIVGIDWQRSLSSLVGGTTRGIIHVDITNEASQPYRGSVLISTGPHRFIGNPVTLAPGTSRRMHLDIGLPVPSWGHQRVVARFGDGSTSDEHWRVPWLLVAIVIVTVHLIAMAGRDWLGAALVSRVRSERQAGIDAGYAAIRQLREPRSDPPSRGS